MSLKTFEVRSTVHNSINANIYRIRPRAVADAWEKAVWDFQARSGSAGYCPLFLHFLGNSKFKKCLGKCLEVPDILPPDIRDHPSPAY